MEDEEAKNLHEHLEKILDRQLSWIQSADSKAAIVLPMSIAMIGSIAALAPKELCAWDSFSITLSAITSFFLLLSVVFLGLSTFPKTTGPEGSMIFFGGIASRSLEDYKEQSLKITSSTYTIDLINQIHRNAQIAGEKHMTIKRSIICLYIVIIPWALTVYTLYGLEK